MKKIVGILMLVIIMVMMISAVAEENLIWNDVYNWYKNTDNYKIFINEENADSSGGYNFVKNSIVYGGGYNCYISEEYYSPSIKEMENKCKEYLEEELGINVTVKINVIGEKYRSYEDDIQYVLETIVMTENYDIRKIENERNTFKEFDEPIYGFVMISYDKY